ncbi:MAG: class I SAM-dependent methyltransferase [Chitinophagales bacterium]
MYFHAVGRPFVRKKIRPLLPHLPEKDKILDIGSGNGLVACLLREKGFDLSLIDIHEGQYDPSVKPLVYDGKKIPFPDDHFHTGMILTVLHHIEEPELALAEAARVCKRLIIMEDIYSGNFQKKLTFFLDRVANLFYSPCPHTNKTDTGWKETFEKFGLKITAVHYRRVLFFVQQGIYVLEKTSGK